MKPTLILIAAVILLLGVGLWQGSIADTEMQKATDTEIRQ